MLPAIRASLRFMRWFALFSATLVVGVFAEHAASADLSDAEIRALLIQHSIASYSGNCPCPYNLDRAGRQCGKRSAYSKPGGSAPLCYAHDVSQEMVEKFRRQSSGT